MSDLIPQVENVVNEAVAAAPQVATFADVGLDTAAMAATQIAEVENVKDPEAAGAEILSLKSRVAQLEEVVKDMPAVLDALKTFTSNAPDYAALKEAVAQVASAIPELNNIVPRIDQLEADLPAAKAVIDEIEAALPADWKTHLMALLVHSKQYFGV